MTVEQARQKGEAIARLLEGMSYHEARQILMAAHSVLEQDYRLVSLTISNDVSLVRIYEIREWPHFIFINLSMWKTFFESFKLLLNIKDLSFKLNSLQTEIVDLRVKFGELSFQISELNKKYDELKKIVDAFYREKDSSNDKQPLPVSRKDIIYHNNLLWLKGELIPYCPKCFDIEGRLVHMQRITRYYGSKKETVGFDSYSCPRCNLLNPIVEPPS